MTGLEPEVKSSDRKVLISAAVNHCPDGPLDDLLCAFTLAVASLPHHQVDLVITNSAVKNNLSEDILAHPGVRLVIASNPAHWLEADSAALKSTRPVFDLLNRLDARFNYDLIVISSTLTSELLAANASLLERSHVYFPMGDAQEEAEGIRTPSTHAEGLNFPLRFLCLSSNQRFDVENIIASLDSTELRIIEIEDSSHRDQVLAEIATLIATNRPIARESHEQNLKVIVAGHDLKFFHGLGRQLQNSYDIDILQDKWSGHNSHDEEFSLALLMHADVIFCEWCLGNLAWYSKNKLPGQRLVARFHLQERELPYVGEASWDSIDHIAYVSECVRRDGQSEFGFPEAKTSVIPNFLDDAKFTVEPKLAEAKYTLGLIGAVPKRKRLDLAIDLLESLIKEDPRYCLRVKGKNPLEYPWLLKRPDELAYYSEIFERINSSPELRYRVIFDPAGDDVNRWFRMVGTILSPSDFESFHMAIGEALLTGSHAVIWSWDGADEIWGSHSIVSSVDEAKALVLSQRDKDYQRLIAHPASMVVEQWYNVLTG